MGVKMSLTEQGYSTAFINGSLTKLSGQCVEWCKEQHYAFNNNEIVGSLWIPVVALFVLIIYWSLQNADYDIKQKFMMTFGISEAQFNRSLAYGPVLVMVLLLMFLIYFPIRFL